MLGKQNIKTYFHFDKNKKIEWVYFHKSQFYLQSFKNIILFILKNQDTLCSTLGLPCSSQVLSAKPTWRAEPMGLVLPKTLTRIHGLDSDRRVTADGEAKAVLPPRDGDLGHSPA